MCPYSKSLEPLWNRWRHRSSDFCAILLHTTQMHDVKCRASFNECWQMSTMSSINILIVFNVQSLSVVFRFSFWTYWYSSNGWFSTFKLYNQIKGNRIEHEHISRVGKIMNPFANTLDDWLRRAFLREVEDEVVCKPILFKLVWRPFWESLTLI